MNNYPLEALTVPTLIVHAKDDPLVSYAAAQRAASRIHAPAGPGATRSRRCLSGAAPVPVA